MSDPAKLTRKQFRAIAGLLAEPTLSKAAAKADVGVSTLRRWWKLPEFQEAFRAAGRQMVQRSIGRLQRMMGMAVSALSRNLKCGKPSDEIRAAVAILEKSLQGLEVVQMAGKFEELQAVLATLTEQAEKRETDDEV
jgi:hypothetical protein